MHSPQWLAPGGSLALIQQLLALEEQIDIPRCDDTRDFAFRAVNERVRNREVAIEHALEEDLDLGHHLGMSRVSGEGADPSG